MGFLQSRLIDLFKISWTLLRLIAVVSSSIVTILSSFLPLFIHTSLSTGYLLFMFIFLSSAAIIVHGGLTHLFNDYADFLSGTDAKSPAVLSGGSRVIQKGLLPPQTVFKLGTWMTIILLIIAIVMAFFNRFELTILILIGIWAAISYSLPPLQLSYRPFVGEWLSMFPAVFFLGLAGPWIILDTIPLWAYQNAVINALICMAWVMVHHIPDIQADKMATPKKRTSVVWFVEKYDIRFAKAPAVLYIAMASLFATWLLTDRLWTGIIVIGLLCGALLLILKIKPNNLEQVTNIEKVILLLAMIIGIVLGIF